MCHHYTRNLTEEPTTSEREDSELFEETELAEEVELLTDGGDEDGDD